MLPSCSRSADFQELITPASQVLPPFSTLGICFSKIDIVIDMLGGRQTLTGKTTSEVNDAFLKPLTKCSELSLCDQLITQPYKGLIAEANVFISHAWKYKFLDVMEAVELFVKHEGRRADETVIWFDMYSNSQHQTGDRPFEWWRGVFINAIKKLGMVLMILDPWDKPITLTRAWCVMELLACESTQSRFAVSMSNTEGKRFAATVNSEGAVWNFHNMLSRVNTAKCEAFIDSDRQRIHEAVVQLLPNGFSSLDSMVLRVFEKWLLSYLKTRIATVTDVREILELKLSVAQLLRCQGSHDEALSIGNECLQRSHGPQLDSGYPIRCLSTLGDICREKCDYDAAEVHYKHCFEKSMGSLGYGHPLTFASINNLALLFKCKGKLREAGELLQCCSILQSKVLGSNHPNTLMSVSNLADSLTSQGQFDVAESLHQSCVSSRKELLGDNHPATLTAVNNLGLLHRLQGKFDAAESLIASSMENTNRLLGSEHPDTLSVLLNTASLHMERGRYGTAEVLNRECLEKRIKVLGHEHPDTVAATSDLAVALKYQGKFDEAEPLCQRCFELYCRILGSEHPDTLSALHNLADMKRIRGMHTSAEELFLKCLEARSRILDDDHPNTLTTMHELSRLYIDCQKYGVAEPLIQRCFLAANRKLGPSHRITLSAMHFKAVILHNTGSCSKAESLFLQCINLKDQALGRDHPDTLTSVISLAIFYVSQFKCDMAEPLFLRCVETFKRTLGPEHPDTQQSIVNLDGCRKIAAVR
jgi:tetratricopeptide (TPR) repeat protein